MAILANGELISLLFLSYFILGEWSTERFIGVIVVLTGLFTIHYAEISKSIKIQIIKRQESDFAYF